MNNFVNVKHLGAAGDGIADDAPAIQSALDMAENGGKVYIPAGNYRIGRTLYIGDGTTIWAEPDARLFVCEKTPKKRGDFLLSNRDPAGGNRDISVIGGTWDGNFDGKNNTKPADLFDPNAFSGSTLNFVNVKNLTLQSLNMRNSVVYYIRMAKLDGFVIRDIHFSSDRRAFNQDGLHFGGEVRHGLIENITASSGQTNDDMIAFNADDSMVRLENLDLCCGPIEDITVRGVFAENCYTGFRLLSVNSPIRNITMQDISIGCRHFALNMDGARYCRTPLIKPGEKPNGSGLIENVTIDNLTVGSVESAGEKALILAETVLKNVKITNFRRLDTDFKKPTLLITNAPGSFGEMHADGNTLSYRLADDKFRREGDFDSVIMNSDAEGTLE
ncbi:MAG: endopolygalacturonase [Clostridia bacterium]|nr:endopolygalacturonase [Clostridia bacterium]